VEPVSVIHLEDDTEPNDTQDESDDTQKQPDDTQKQRNTNLKRRGGRDHESSKDIESKEKKLRMEEAAHKCPRSRPRKTSTDKKAEKRAEKRAEKEFSVVVYVEVAVPPTKLHAGKTHKGDKMVLQAPRRCGPFSMFRRTKWSSFLKNIAAVTGIDKENLLLPGMTWRM